MNLRNGFCKHEERYTTIHWCTLFFLLPLLSHKIPDEQCMRTSQMRTQSWLHGDQDAFLLALN